jgi:hypothetical protein
MSIRVHIERLVLEGLPLGEHDGPRVQAAVETELARLLGDQAPAMTGGATPRAHAPEIRIAEDVRPAALGRAIARSLHRGLKR